MAERQRSMAATAMFAAAGAGVLYALYNSVSSRPTNPLCNQSVRIVSHPEDCRSVVKLLRDHCQEFRVLGFDCEWVGYPNRHPVALLQLASHRGLCVLIRMREMRRIPQELRDLLSDPAIVKVGVAPLEDAKLLKDDYNLKVESTLDLRFMAVRCDIPRPYRLDALAETVLGIKMDKGHGISNWEDDKLTEQQVAYAASDAHVAVELFRELAKRAIPRAFFTSEETWLMDAIKEFKCYFNKRFIDQHAQLYAAKR